MVAYKKKKIQLRKNKKIKVNWKGKKKKTRKMQEMTIHTMKGRG